MKCTFCKFVNKEKYSHNDFANHGKTYPLIPIFENKLIFVFLSVPNFHKQTDLLVIPKKHYEFFEDIPQNTLNNLSLIVQKFVKIIRKNYSDCSIILNNGINAEQYVPHAHFHIIPINHNKKPIWQNLSMDEFTKISNDLTNFFNSTH